MTLVDKLQIAVSRPELPECEFSRRLAERWLCGKRLAWFAFNDSIRQLRHVLYAHAIVFFMSYSKSLHHVVLMCGRVGRVRMYMAGSNVCWPQATRSSLTRHLPTVAGAHCILLRFDHGLHRVHPSCRIMHVPSLLLMQSICEVKVKPPTFARKLCNRKIVACRPGAVIVSRSHKRAGQGTVFDLAACFTCGVMY